ncbi:DUF4910 domain-containing protein [Evansella clarkii]|uniref:DUF4910 domain-containing protein n=1 Tax=Evansella clarkii TaxID=79879 RepID=UPI0009965C7F|nr:DUF4910 domain-containing protein [Evansella clarkii]
MFNEWRKRLEEEFSGKQAYRYAERIAQFHRIQASTGYREAAHTAASMLKRDGVEAEIISYPAKKGERFLAHRSFQEWHCNHGELWIEGENRQRIARYNEEEISIIQRSVSTPPEGVYGELAVVENAEDPESYKDIDIKGKIALVRGNQFLVHDLAVEKHGAAGLIFDNLNEYPPIRTRLDMPDAIQYTSYWWHGDEKKSFGFAVSPRTGEILRKKAEKETVRLFAKVNAELYDGNFENIEYYIPGKKKEEILLVSHLCHPYPGGQDNASGPGTLMETMRALNELISSGRLPEPDLSIRFLMMPEMTGTYAYFDQHPERIPLTVAALNLDMVGADQQKGGGPLCIEQPPMATPTFTDRFAYKLFESVSVDTSNFTGTASYSTVNFVKTRFSGGSDHYVISDPSIGIPCPMLIQWPDKNYHTTADTTHGLDPGMMKKTGLTTALYAYGLANGTEDEWISILLDDIASRYTDLVKNVNWFFQKVHLAEDWQDTLDFYTDYEDKALSSYLLYAHARGFSRLEDKTAEALVQLAKQFDAIEDWAGDKAKLYGGKNDGMASVGRLPEYFGSKVFKRVYEGPYSLLFELDRLPVDEKLTWYQTVKETNPEQGYDTFIQYWMDGEQNLTEVLELVKKETGMYNPVFAEKFIEISKRLGLIEEV